MKNIRRKNTRIKAIKYQKMPTGHQHTEEYRERKSAKQRESKDVNGLRCHNMSRNSRIIISCNMPKQISVEGNGHCCHRPSSNWETNRDGRMAKTCRRISSSIWMRR